MILINYWWYTQAIAQGDTGHTESGCPGHGDGEEQVRLRPMVRWVISSSENDIYENYEIMKIAYHLSSVWCVLISVKKMQWKIKCMYRSRFLEQIKGQKKYKWRKIFHTLKPLQRRRDIHGYIPIVIYSNTRPFTHAGSCYTLMKYWNEVTAA